MKTELLSEEPGGVEKAPVHDMHLVLSSHWDREWYLPFQKFREKLVRVLDQVLHDLDSGHLPCFEMDGQFVPVEDYLQIRPEKRALVKRLIAQKRLCVGPWYVLPDEFLVSGESLIRNLLMGMRRSTAMGACSRVGWLCDLFGHNSQMPQLLRQLGVDNAFVWRGFPFDLPGHVRWQSPDGSWVLAHRFMRNGYIDFPVEVGRINDRGLYPDVREMVDLAAAQMDRYRQFYGNVAWLFFDGADHIEYRPKMVDFVKEFNRRFGREVLRISTLEQFLRQLQSQLPEELHVIQGEQREPATLDTLGWLIPGVGSSRIPLKQANHATETLLTQWSEYWCGVAEAALGLEYPSRSLELAWEYLIRNHPHDSICGCSTDETHRSMCYRFDQARQIGEVHLERAHEHLAAARLRDRLGSADLGVVLFAPAGGETQTCPEVTARLPRHWPQFQEFFSFESKPSIVVEDASGQSINWQLLEAAPSTLHSRVPPGKMPVAEDRQHVRLVVDTSVPAGQQQMFILKPGQGPTRSGTCGMLGIARDTLRNEFLQVQAQPGGTLTLTDLGSGATYAGLLAMEDTSDTGDGWCHGQPPLDRTYLSTQGTVSHGLAANGPLLARLYIRVEWLVPRDFDFKEMRRSDELVPLTVEHLVTLRKGAVVLEVQTTIHNTPRDHRLRLLAPTQLSTSVYWSDTPFDNVERMVGMREDAHLLREMQVEMTPQQNWVAASDGHHGLALLAPGQYESAVLDQPDRPLCLTLLRGFRKAYLTDGNEGGQILGTHHVKMGFHPFSGAVPFARLHRLAQSLAAPVRGIFLDRTDLRELEPPPIQPLSPPRVQGDVVVSVQYRHGDHWVVRVFNPGDQPQPVVLTGGFRWVEVNLHEEAQSATPFDRFVVRPRGITTFKSVA